MPANPIPLNLTVVRADFEAAQRRPSLMENFGYEYGHRLLAELERCYAIIGDGDLGREPGEPGDLCSQCGGEMFRRHDNGVMECAECVAEKEPTA